MYTIHIILRKSPLKDVYIGLKKTEEFTNIVAIKEAEHSHIYEVENERLRVPISDEIRNSLSEAIKDAVEKSDFINIKMKEDEYNKYFGPASERTSICYDVTEEQFNEFFK